MALAIWYMYMYMYLCFHFALQVHSIYYFVNPPSEDIHGLPDPVYTIGDILEIKWGSDGTGTEFKSFQLWLNQGDYIGRYAISRELLAFPISNDPQADKSLELVTADAWSYNWTIKLSGFNLSDSNVFWFEFPSSGIDSAGHVTNIFSHNFNLTEPSTTTASRISSTTSSKTTQTSVLTSRTTSIPPATIPISRTTTTSIASTAASSASTEPSSSSSSSPSSGGLSTGAKAGIGVAIPIAVIAAIAGGLFFARRKQKKQKNPVEEPMQEQPARDSLPYMYELSTDAPISELPGNSPKSPTEPVEMPAISK
ncbi:hypothetical protein BGW36DRAFT_445819 [Talaromyces proteolyticus]|uniref:Mid2 domain-containing protein n=1 Tax=Talaromyces proteolyticus TaxID=1131652 RepID=A0AAD4Q1F5_9EURO|nr:uncharacterized protein BGW36DRAFT_445819 [Talaromyces proteolyticus]KAH8702229.1 hypothetical protein BGW36DRAFT_445819 [Talaromyces proteolyticus]